VQDITATEGRSISEGAKVDISIPKTI